MTAESIVTARLACAVVTGIWDGHFSEDQEANARVDNGQELHCISGFRSFHSFPANVLHIHNL